MISIYELIKRAKKGEVLYTTAPARNVTSAASKLERKVATEQCLVYSVRGYGASNHRDPRRLLRVEVLS